MPAPFDLIFEGLDGLDARWKRQVRDRIVNDASDAVMRAANAGAQLARQLVPVSSVDRSEVNTRTAHLRDKIAAVFLSSSVSESGAFKSVAAEIKAAASYASYVENGTRPHEIPVGRKGFLAWENPQAQGDWIFALHTVHHPGTKPHPFMGPAYHATERELERQMTMTVERAADDFNRD
jgi:HK97 gp10 family phage protein